MSASFFFNDTATTEIYTLSLHDALPIFTLLTQKTGSSLIPAYYLFGIQLFILIVLDRKSTRLNSDHLVCRLLLEKKKTSGTSHSTLAHARNVVVMQPELRQALCGLADRC